MIIQKENSKHNINQYLLEAIQKNNPELLDNVKIINEDDDEKAKEKSNNQIKNEQIKRNGSKSAREIYKSNHNKSKKAHSESKIDKVLKNIIQYVMNDNDIKNLVEKNNTETNEKIDEDGLIDIIIQFARPLVKEWDRENFNFYMNNPKSFNDIIKEDVIKHLNDIIGKNVEDNTEKSISNDENVEKTDENSEIEEIGTFSPELNDYLTITKDVIGYLNKDGSVRNKDGSNIIGQFIGIGVLNNSPQGYRLIQKFNKESYINKSLDKRDKNVGALKLPNNVKTENRKYSTYGKFISLLEANDSEEKNNKIQQFAQTVIEKMKAEKGIQDIDNNKMNEMLNYIVNYYQNQGTDEDFAMFNNESYILKQANALYNNFYNGQEDEQEYQTDGNQVGIVVDNNRQLIGYSDLETGIVYTLDGDKSEDIIAEGKRLINVLQSIKESKVSNKIVDFAKKTIEKKFGVLGSKQMVDGIVGGLASLPSSAIAMAGGFKIREVAKDDSVVKYYIKYLDEGSKVKELMQFFCSDDVRKDKASKYIDREDDSIVRSMDDEQKKRYDIQKQRDKNIISKELEAKKDIKQDLLNATRGLCYRIIVGDKDDMDKFALAINEDSSLNEWFIMNYTGRIRSFDTRDRRIIFRDKKTKLVCCILIFQPQFIYARKIGSDLLKSTQNARKR